MRRPQDRILSLSAALEWRRALRRDGRVLAVTNGCFDVLTPGHVQALEAAAAHGDALLVLLNSDASVRALKGTTRPIHDQTARGMVLASLRSVAAVVVFDGADCAAELAALAPDAYAKSTEYRGRQNPAEAAALAACGAEVVWLPRDPRYSTSGLVERMRAADAAGGRLVVTPSGVCGEGERAEALTTSQEEVER